MGNRGLKKAKLTWNRRHRSIFWDEKDAKTCTRKGRLHFL